MGLKHLFSAALLAMALALTACSANRPESAALVSVDERVEALMKEMTPEQKIGQLFIVGIYGTGMNDDTRFLLNEFGFGGVILYDRNLESREQTAALTAALQKENSAPVPLFIAIDEEGGIVARMKSALTPPPAAAELGRAGDAGAAREWAKRTADELLSIGVNLNFAPVADLGLEPERSYSDDPEEVTRFVRAVAEGFEERGLIYTLKHFPGIGRKGNDTHTGEVVVDLSLEELREKDIVPFEKTISERSRSDFFIMAGHVLYPKIDKELPASLSPRLMGGLLRKSLGWDGVTVTDDLAMGAVAKLFTAEEAALSSFEAGADILLICHDTASQIDAYNAFLRSYREGTLSKERLDASLRRVLRVKLSHLEHHK